MRELFFYLLAHPEGLTKEEIGATILPESSASQLKIQFKNLTYRLRRSLGQDTITFDNERYSFNTGLDFKYDVEIFERKIEEAKSVESSDKKLSTYQDALALYRGPYLVDLSGTWVMPERQRYLNLYLDAAADAARIYSEREEYDKTLSYSDIILKEDRCYEEAYRLKMLAYAGLGNQAEIIRQYELCRKVLAEEINAKPSPQTEALFFQLTQ